MAKRGWDEVCKAGGRIIPVPRKISFDAMKAEEFKKKVKRRPTFKEDDLNIRCVDWFDRHYRRYSKLLHHSPNEGKRSEKQGAKLKKMGMRSGFPDLILLLPTQHFSFLAIELKKIATRSGEENGQLTDNEKGWGAVAEELGGVYSMVRTIEHFKLLVSAYMEEAEDWLTERKKYGQNTGSERIKEISQWKETRTRLVAKGYQSGSGVDSL